MRAAFFRGWPRLFPVARGAHSEKPAWEKMVPLGAGAQDEFAIQGRKEQRRRLRVAGLFALAVGFFGGVGGAIAYDGEELSDLELMPLGNIPLVAVLKSAGMGPPSYDVSKPGKEVDVVTVQAQHNGGAYEMVFSSLNNWIFHSAINNDIYYTLKINGTFYVPGTDGKIRVRYDPLAVRTDGSKKELDLSIVVGMSQGATSSAMAPMAGEYDDTLTMAMETL